MGVVWTKEQLEVIKERDKNILVSAAAGSGKTAVMVERILSLIRDEDNPCDIDRFLIVTFTRAAADEMRERIRKRLEKAYKENPGNRHLLKQLTLIHHADITTIDSFCMKVVRSYFEEVSLEPGFRVAEEGELKLLRQDAIEEVLEEAYSKKNPEFCYLVDCFTNGKTDQELEKIIWGVYTCAQSFPWPNDWLMKCFHESKEQRDEWLEAFFLSLKNSMESWRKSALRAKDICNSPGGPYFYEEAIKSDISQIEDMIKETDFAHLFQLIQLYNSKRLSSNKDEKVLEEKKEDVKRIRDRYKKDLEALKKKFFDLTFAQQLEIMEKSQKVIQEIIRLVLRFTEKYQEIKEKNNLVDFSDLEHKAVEILLKKEEDGYIRTDAAKSYANRYDQIFIDEYQDSNLIQEILIKAVSKEEQGISNLFMVGDVKQSIYSFRMARPELFLEKYEAYGKDGEKAVKIDLQKNFRSRSGIVKSVNSLFYQIMQKDIGKITYDDSAALYTGASYPEKKESTEIMLLKHWGYGKDTGKTAKELEALMCAKKIREIISNELVTDENTGVLRKARYSDIVILLRTMEGWAETFQEVLQRENIPSRTMLRNGYFSSYEIQTVMNYLRILDNPRQDIPLTSVMKSAIGMFGDEELAVIRSKYKEGLFYHACVCYKEEQTDELAEKLDGFLLQLNTFRKKMTHVALHELLWEIYEVTGLEAYIASMPGGTVRKANMEMLVEQAMKYEELSYKGVFHFVQYIDRLIKFQVDFGNANGNDSHQDLVEIQSIHKSKGLEYPIVIVAGLGKQFNEQDSKETIIMHHEYGMAADYIVPELRVKCNSLKKKFLQRKMREEMLGEELRVLYVAMTRAKEKLILSGVCSKLSELQKWKTQALEYKTVLTFEEKYKAKSFLDFIVPAILNMDVQENYEIRFIEEEELVFDVVETELKKQLTTDIFNVYPKDEQYEIIAEQLKEISKEVTDQSIPVKLSVSELKKRGYMHDPDEDGQAIYEEEITPLIPDFLAEEQVVVGGSIRGDAYHHLMEYIDFSIDPQKDFEEKVIACAKEHGMGEAELGLIRLEDIRKFFSSELGMRAKAAHEKGMLYKEKPFVMGVNAEQILGQNIDETILVQGIIDAYFCEEDGIVLYDYKTDRLYREQQYIDHYHVQLEYYKQALEQALGKKVKEVYIYSFTLGKMITL